MKKRNHPLSPHLQIYKPQLTSLLSILHRFTGIGLSIGFFLLIGFLYGVTVNEKFYGCFMKIAATLWGKLIILGFVGAFWYHLFNGIRHLFWDAGYNLELKDVYASGYFVITMTILLTLITALLFWGKLV